MDFIHNISKSRLIEVSINIDDVLDRIYSQSALHVSYHPECILLTSDNGRLLEQSITDAVNALVSSLSGYVAFVNINPNAESEGIFIALKLPRGCVVPEGVGYAMRCAVVEAICNHVLAGIYERATGNGLYRTGWRAGVALARVLMARAERGIGLTN